MPSTDMPIHDRYTGPLMAISAVLLLTGVVVAMAAGAASSLLNVACGFVLSGLVVAVAAGVARHRYEQHLRAARRSERTPAH